MSSYVVSWTVRLPPFASLVPTFPSGRFKNLFFVCRYSVPTKVAWLFLAASGSATCTWCSFTQCFSTVVAVSDVLAAQGSLFSIYTSRPLFVLFVEQNTYHCPHHWFWDCRQGISWTFFFVCRPPPKLPGCPWLPLAVPLGVQGHSLGVPQLSLPCRLFWLPMLLHFSIYKSQPLFVLLLEQNTYHLVHHSFLHSRQGISSTFGRTVKRWRGGWRRPSELPVCHCSLGPWLILGACSLCFCPSLSVWCLVFRSWLPKLLLFVYKNHSFFLVLLRKKF